MYLGSNSLCITKNRGIVNNIKTYPCSDFNIVHGVYTTVNTMLQGNLFATIKVVKKIVLLNILYMHVAPMTSLAELISKMFLYALL